MAILLQSLAPEQTKLLELISEVQQTYHVGPVWSYLEHEFDRLGLSALEVLSFLPWVGVDRVGSRHYGLVWIDSNIPMPGTKVYLTIAGRHHVQGNECGRIDAFVALLKGVIAARLRAPISPIEVQEAYVTRRELRDQASNATDPLFEPDMIDQIKMLVDHEPVLAHTVNSDPDDEDGWRIELRREVVLYKEVQSVEQYIMRVTELLSPLPVESVEPFPSPLGIVAALDYLDVVWQLRFGKPLVQPINGERTARLALSVNTREELSAQLSSVAQLLKGLRVSRKPGEYPVQAIVSHLDQQGILDEVALGRVRDAVAVLGAVINIRNAQQHGGGQDRGVQATRTLGISYPIADPSQAWRRIQNRIVAALTTLREEVYASGFSGEKT